MPTEPVAVEKPKHPLYALTTYELRDYRRQLERAVGFYIANHPDAPVLPRLRETLGNVLAEQEGRPGRRLVADRPHDVSALTGPELDRARRELAASLALARPGPGRRSRCRSWPGSARSTPS
jgi:hypothetical protein